MKRILFYAFLAFSVTSCAAIPNLAGPGIDPDFSTDWKKVDSKTLEDYEKSGGKYSLFTTMNEVGTWSSGTKAVFIQPSDCEYQTYNDGDWSLSCKFMAEMKDIPKDERKEYPIPEQDGEFYTRKYDTDNPIVYNEFFEAMSEINKRIKDKQNNNGE